MDIKSFGGEFKLIEAVGKKPRFHPVIVGIGDDCAVLPLGEKKYQIVTKDMLVEEDHFSLSYFKPQEVGRKAIESNVSDIASMGGIPKYAFIAISLKKDTSVEWVKNFYQGMNSRLAKHKIDLIGGDTTHSSLISISITLIGEVDKDSLMLRSGANVGDIIKVSGYIGASTAGFKLLKKGIPGNEWVKKKHRNPTCRLDICHEIAKYASSMADISDGLAADLKNIMKQSGVGAVLNKFQIPIDKRTITAANAIGEDAYDMALHGGEDFELIYTVPKKWAKQCPGIELGEVIKGKKLFLKENDRILEVIKSGFDHFS